MKEKGRERERKGERRGKERKNERDEEERRRERDKLEKEGRIIPNTSKINQYQNTFHPTQSNC